MSGAGSQAPPAVEVYPIERLREFSTRVFRWCGVPEEDARLAADVLATADLRGIDTHGVTRLPQYVEMFQRGLINPRPQLRVVRETPSTARVDGDNGLGLVVGSGSVAVGNSNHFGIGEYYALQGLPRDTIVWAMTNSPPQVAPLWGAEKMLGTNPMAIAFPGGEEPAVVIDVTTSAMAFGKVEHAARKGQRIPEGCAVDRDGRMTTDPREMLDGGALLPLGGDFEHGGHKGYCMATLVDMLAAVLSGANWGPYGPPFPADLPVPPRYVGKGVGHFFTALRIDAFIDPDEFRRQVDDWVRTVRGTRPAVGTPGVAIPGDPGRRAEEERRVQGVPVILPVVEQLRRLSAAAGVPFD